MSDDFDHLNEQEWDDSAEPGDWDVVDVPRVTALRVAGKTLVITTNDSNEVFVPMSQIARTSKVRVPGNTGTLQIPRWLADNRCLHWIEDIL